VGWVEFRERHMIAVVKSLNSMMIVFVISLKLWIKIEMDESVRKIFYPYAEDTSVAKSDQ
jgi:hypothetical protein